MKDSTRLLLEKSERAIEAAIIVHREGALEFAAGRAYYAMFYVFESSQGLSGNKDVLKSAAILG